ncbi:MAG: NAD(P)/FAD-dependent oxidoreductase [Candidatus Altiarchaeota archaeon]|nr:NAD(P)/FAD-dependent oxidoreductase [Candidatus Altiarchaeota archaeon]
MKVIIGGGGPAGLTAAYLLSKKGFSSTVYEAGDDVGGIAKTVEYKGYLFDLGGHRFFTKMKRVESIWHDVLGDEFLVRSRLSRIYYNGKFFNYPLKLTNVVYNMGIAESFAVFLSYVKSALLPKRPDDSFEDYVINRFGKRLYETFFRIYTEKVWGMPCTEIRAEWAAQRIKGMSFTSVVKTLIFGNKGDIKSLIERFHYPRYGPGQLWKKMAEDIQGNGGEVFLNSKIVGVNVSKNMVDSVRVSEKNKVRDVELDYFISTLPLKDLVLMIKPKPPQDVLDAAKKLRYRDFLIVSLIIDKKSTWPDNWIYIHDKNQKVGRIQNYVNWSPYMVPEKDKACVGMEYFCFEGDETWNMKDDKLIALASRELTELGLIEERRYVVDGTVVRVKKAYPVYDMEYRRHLDKIIKYLSPVENMYTIGRNGTHKYNNMDHSMLTSIYAVENIEGAKNNIWAVNTDQEYHETKTK